MYLRNSVALITGGSQGLGKGFAKAVLEAGGRVSLLDIKEEIGQKTAKEFNAHFGANSALFVRCDVRKDPEVEAAFQKTLSTFNRLDLVVNNAGVATPDSWDRNTVTSDSWKNTIDINLMGVMRCCFTAFNYLASSKNGTGGHIINISSAAGLTAVPSDPAYAASKHGVVGLSRCLAGMWASESIRVSCLCPSFADTEIVQSILPSLDPSAAELLQSLGIMSVDTVVDAFKKLLEAQDSTGGVLAVTPAGVKYKHQPRTQSKL